MSASCLAAVSVTPTDVITWYGRTPPNAPAGTTWNWTPFQPSNPVIDSTGRVYFIGAYESDPPVGSLFSHRGVFTATNSSDVENFRGIHAGGTLDGFDLNDSTVSTGPIGFTAPRVSGSKVAFGLQFSGGTPAAIESGPGQNNTAMYGGNYAGGVSTVARQGDAVTLIGNTNAPTAAEITADYKLISQQESEINSSGTLLSWLAVSTDSGDFTPGSDGNNGFLATKTAGGGYNVIAQGGTPAPGVGRFQNGFNGVGGFFAKINRNGQVAFDAKLANTFPVTAGSDDAAYIHTPGSGTVLVRREGQIAPDTTGAPDAGGALYTDYVNTSSRSFSNAGMIFTSNLSGGDADTTPGSENNSALYLATPTGTTRVIRQNDPIPTLGPGVNLGTVNPAGSNMSISNNGRIAFGATLQGSGVTANVFPDATFEFPPENGIVLTAGVQGNDQVVMTGPANDLRPVARRGDAAPGLPGMYLNFESAALQIAMNNNGDMLFRSGTTPYAAGAAIGVVGQTVGQSILPAGPEVLLAWTLADGLVPMLFVGQSVEVDPGVFKTVAQFSVAGEDNGDGGVSGLSDDGHFVASLYFDDNSWGIVKLQIPATGTGSIFLLGLTALARRRRAS